MKNRCLVVLALALGLVGFSKNASAFWIGANAFVMPGGAQATACNYGYNAPLTCQVQVRGFYPNGVFIDARSSLYLMPGTCNYAFVNSGYYPFSFAQAAADCSFLY